ncbi:hypothetical protein OH492_14065 [Vibrio chagasii]|nr:hypothetical protein [Vibrio chagasii]
MPPAAATASLRGDERYVEISAAARLACYRLVTKLTVVKFS